MGTSGAAGCQERAAAGRTAPESSLTGAPATGDSHGRRAAVGSSAAGTAGAADSHGRTTVPEPSAAGAPGAAGSHGPRVGPEPSAAGAPGADPAHSTGGVPASRAGIPVSAGGRGVAGEPGAMLQLPAGVAGLSVDGSEPAATGLDAAGGDGTGVPALGVTPAIPACRASGDAGAALASAVGPPNTPGPRDTDGRDSANGARPSATGTDPVSSAGMPIGIVASGSKVGARSVAGRST